MKDLRMDARQGEAEIVKSQCLARRIEPIRIGGRLSESVPVVESVSA